MAVPLLAATLLFIGSLLIDREYDWDLDSFLYLGSRLDQGELLYFQDFETKLPFLQYIFWVPFQLGGIGAWKIITFLSCLILAWAGTSKLISKNPFKATGRYITELLFLAGLFMLRMYSLPSSESAHIEMISAACMFYAATLSLKGDEASDLALLNIAIAGLFAGIATLIRPNYLFTFPAFFIFWIYSSTLLGQQKVKSPLTKILLFCFASGFIIAGSFLPYFFYSNGIPTLISGMKAIASFPNDGVDLFTAQVRNAETLDLYAALCIFLIILGVLFLKKNKLFIHDGRNVSGVYLFCCCGMLLLEYSFVRTHYFTHNSILFTPYWVLLVWLIYPIAIDSIRRRAQHNGIKCITLSLLAVLLVIGIFLKPLIIIGQDIYSVLSKSVEVNLSINQRNLDQKLKLTLTQIPSTTTWYIVDRPIYHAILNQSRIGDAHPAMLQYIFSGHKIQPVGNIYLYSDEVSKNYCLIFFRSAKDLIIVRDDLSNIANKKALDCLSSKESPYDKYTSMDPLNQRLKGLDPVELNAYSFFLLNKNKLPAMH